MKSEYYIREACTKAIATKLARRAQDYVTQDMVEAREGLEQAQIKFNGLVEDAAHQMLNGR